MKQRGSALIIAMMFIGLIGAVAFGIAKLIFADTSINTLSENGAIAYYAAESGVEEGFLRYRYNQNAEVPFASWTYGNTKVFRSDLVAKTVIHGAYAGIDSSTAASPTASNQTYDLKMGYLGTNITPGGGPFFYNDVNKDGSSESIDIFNASYDTGDYSFLFTPQDEARKFDLTNFDLSKNTLAIGIKFLGVNAPYGVPLVVTPSIECKAMAEIKFTVTSSGGAIVKEYKALTVYNANSCSSVLGIPEQRLTSAHPTFNVLGGWTNWNPNTLRVAGNPNYYYSMDPTTFVSKLFTEAGDPVLAPSNYDNVTMSIKPLNYSADITFISTECNSNGSCTVATDKNKVVTGPYTYMTSIGYYGGVTRTLTANIDRQSGTLYDLYDYVLYKEN